VTATATLGLLTGHATAGPPFVTDDPKPVPYQHFEFYSFSLGTAIRLRQAPCGVVDNTPMSRAHHSAAREATTDSVNPTDTASSRNALTLPLKQILGSFCQTTTKECAEYTCSQTKPIAQRAGSSVMPHSPLVTRNGPSVTAHGPFGDASRSFCAVTRRHPGRSQK
jgi:hypothetical protein